MITAIFAGVLLLALGALAKGFFAHLMIVFLAWLAKNGLLLGALQTRAGQRLVRNVRYRAYTHASQGEKRRRVYRVFRLAGQVEDKALRGLAKAKSFAASMLGNGRRKTKSEARPAPGKLKP
jgi:hypothetical protein